MCVCMCLSACVWTLSSATGSGFAAAKSTWLATHGWRMSFDGNFPTPLTTRTARMFGALGTLKTAGVSTVMGVA